MRDKTRVGARLLYYGLRRKDIKYLTIKYIHTEKNMEDGSKFKETKEEGRLQISQFGTWRLAYEKH